MTWSLLSNNPVNKYTYLCFCVLDLVIIVFYALILVTRVHYTNHGPSHISGISLSNVRVVDRALGDIPHNHGWLLLFLNIGILGTLVLIYLALFVMALFLKKHHGLDRASLLKKCLCLVLVMLLTFLHMPLYDLLMRTFSLPFTSLSLLIIRFSISSLGLFLLFFLNLYLVRIFNICVPAELVPWCGPISKIAYVNLVIKLLLVISVNFDMDGKYALVEIIVLMFMQSFQACYRMLFAPNFLQETDIMVKTKDFTVAFLFFLGIVCKIVKDTSDLDLLYFIVFAPVVTMGWWQFEQYRREQIMLKIKQKQLKLEVEYEYALYAMMCLVRDSMGESVEHQRVFGQLMDLMLTHIEECEDERCICAEMENFYDLLKMRMLSTNQDVVPLLRAERKKFKKIIDDMGLIGTISNMTALVFKGNDTSESTNAQNEAERQMNNQNNNNDREMAR